MEHFTGALLDPRPIEQKIRDHTHEEQLGGGLILDWQEKTDWTKLSVRNQSTSSSCGGQSGAKGVEAILKRIESAVPIYERRSNKPDLGMYMQEIGDILKKKGTTTETLVPSQNMTEEQMAQVSYLDTPDVIDGYYFIENNIDLIATALEKGHPVLVAVASNAEEWQAQPIFNGNPVTFRHFVCAVPKNYLLRNGEKCIVIDDSCNRSTTLENSAQRILSESFLKDRCWGLMALIPHVEAQKPTYTFINDLVYGMSGDDVKALQECLIWERLLQPGYNTGFFGNLTKTAVIKFQEKYAGDILTPIGLTHGTGNVRSMTRNKLNFLYSD